MVVITSSLATANYIGKKLYKFYKGKILCDLWLQSNDGVDFMAHRCVCAASSLVIGSVISSVGELSPQASILIPLNSIDASILVHILDFMYLGEISVKDYQVDSLLHASQVLEMANLEEACQEALQKLSSLNLLDATKENHAAANANVRTVPEPVVLKMEKSDECDNHTVVSKTQAKSKPKPDKCFKYVDEEGELTVVEAAQSDDTGSGDYDLDDSRMQYEAIPVNLASVKDDRIDKDHLQAIEASLLVKSFAERKSVQVPLECEECDLTFTSTSALAKHRMLHAGEEEHYQCAKCGKILFSKKSLAEHEAKHEVIKKSFNCSICSQIFPTKSAWKRHEESHFGTKPYQCQFCNKSFVDENACEQHMDSHSGYNQYNCSFCSFKCNHKLAMYKHEAEHRGITIHNPKGSEDESDSGRLFYCQDCDRSFMHYSSFWMHLRVHADDRRFPCHYCGKSFFTKQQTAIHERIHTGEKPFCCSICGKGFSQPGRVKLHERIHTGEKPYACRHCGKNFAVKGNCDAHERIHTGEKRYECGICGERYGLKSKLIQHQLIHGTPHILEMKDIEVDGSAVTEIAIAMN